MKCRFVPFKAEITDPDPGMFLQEKGNTFA
jgi:hypothetical protein